MRENDDGHARVDLASTVTVVVVVLTMFRKATTKGTHWDSFASSAGTLEYWMAVCSNVNVSSLEELRSCIPAMYFHSRHSRRGLGYLCHLVHGLGPAYSSSTSNLQWCYWAHSFSGGLDSL